MGCWSTARSPPSIKFAGTHLYTWVETGTVREKCLAQEHNTMSPARARTRIARCGDEFTTMSRRDTQGINRSSGLWALYLLALYSGENTGSGQCFIVQTSSPEKHVHMLQPSINSSPSSADEKQHQLNNELAIHNNHSNFSWTILYKGERCIVV